MRRLKILTYIAAAAVLAICVYSFLGGIDVFQGKFKNEFIAWYFLAKGIFSSLALCLLVWILAALVNKSEPGKKGG